jgi:hypothetical protein
VVPHQGWLFETANVDAFLRAHIYAIDVDKMRPGHPFTQLASLESRRQRWRSCVELASCLGLSASTVRRLVRRGIVPHKRCPGAGPYGEIRARADDFDLESVRLATEFASQTKSRC